MTTTFKKPKEVFSEKLMEALEAAQNFHFDGAYYEYFSPTECKLALHEKHREKNLGNDWGFPYDHNLITTIPNYINASPMSLGKHRYIAAQGPRTNTFAEFWGMIWAENVGLIVTVTNEEEGDGASKNFKFNRFWPLEGIHQYDELKVIFKSYRLLHSWSQEKLHLHEFKLVYGTEEKTVYHLYLENWMDNGVIPPESLLTLAQEIDQYKQTASIVVHCAAGIGRTGTVIAFHSLYHDLLEAVQEKNEAQFDVVERVKKMRALRWGAIIATQQQYELVIKTLQLVLEKL